MLTTNEHCVGTYEARQAFPKRLVDNLLRFVVGQHGVDIRILVVVYDLETSAAPQQHVGKKFKEGTYNLNNNTNLNPLPRMKTAPYTERNGKT